MGWRAVRKGYCFLLHLLILQSLIAQEDPSTSLFFPAPETSSPPSLPAGFSLENAAGSATFTYPTAIAIAPDGRIFVTEKSGIVWVIQNGIKLSNPFIDLQNEVLSNGDRGLSGIAVDPNFNTNHYVYVAYTVDPDQNGVDDNSAGFGRVTRYTASGNVAIVSSRRIVLGNSWADGVPSPYHVHTVDALRFGSDGSLLISTGDAAHQVDPDAGGRDPDSFGPGKISTLEDIGAFRAQWIGSLAGKILRIDPATGSGLSSNPFWTGNGTDNQSKVWAYGLRNPWRFTVKPATGSSNPADGNPGDLYIPDCGWWSWDELNVAASRGRNFGWPCYEGPYWNTPYGSATPAHHGCSAIGTPDNPSPPTSPVAAWNHTDPDASRPPGFTGKCAIGALFYTGSSYPAEFRNKCFIADVEDWIRVVDLSGNTVNSISAFATGVGVAVDMALNPVDGNIYIVSVYFGLVQRIVYGGPNGRPVPIGGSNTIAGPPPLNVNFTGSSSYDPNGYALSYLWDFGDGTSSTDPNPTHTYSGQGIFIATLTVRNSIGLQDKTQIGIAVGSNVPRGTDNTQTGRPIASRMNPTGAGNHDINIIKDNLFPPVGSDDLSTQFDTYDGTTPSTDWIGYEWSSPVTLNGLIFQEGKNANSGGWFRSISVEMKNNGNWSSVQNLRITPAYAGNNGTSFETYHLAFNGKRGTAVRITGQTGGTGKFISVAELRAIAGSQLPRIVLSASKTSGMMNLEVRFSGASSSSPEGGPLAFTWDFGDGTYSTESEPIHVYTRQGTYRTILTGTDARGGMASDSITITVYPNTAPTGEIISPSNNSFFIPGDIVHFDAIASDREQAAATIDFSWQIILHHDQHIHPAWYSARGRSFDYVLETEGGDGSFYYEAVLTVSDSGSLNDTRRVFFYPNRRPIIYGLADTVAFQESYFSRSIFAYDPDDRDTLTYSLTSYPGWLSIDALTGRVSGTPTGHDVGTSLVEIRAADNRGAVATQSFSLTVFHVNHPPSPPHQLIPTDQSLLQIFSNPKPITFSWRGAVDSDPGDSVRYSFFARGPGLELSISDIYDTTLSLDIMPQLQVSSVYTWIVAASDGAAMTAAVDSFVFRTSRNVSPINERPGEVPRVYALQQNFPNPFNPSTIIRYDIPRRSKVIMDVVDVLGRPLFDLVSEEQDGGSYFIEWKPEVPSGIYLCRLRVTAIEEPMEDLVLMNKMILVR